MVAPRLSTTVCGLIKVQALMYKLVQESPKCSIQQHTCNK
jgi:hypothetical protein